MAGLRWLLVVLLLAVWLIGVSANWGMIVWALLGAAIVVVLLNIMTVTRRSRS